MGSKTKSVVNYYVSGQDHTARGLKTHHCSISFCVCFWKRESLEWGSSSGKWMGVTPKGNALKWTRFAEWWNPLTTLCCRCSSWPPWRSCCCSAQHYCFYAAFLTQGLLEAARRFRPPQARARLKLSRSTQTSCHRGLELKVFWGCGWVSFGLD